MASLVEVLVSTFIFSVGMVGSSLMALKGLGATRDGLIQTKALSLAETQYEAVLSRGVAYSGFNTWQERVALDLPQGQGVVIQNNKSFIIDVSWQPSFCHHRKSVRIPFRRCEA